MITTNTLTPAQTNSCHCGASECHGECCRLECPSKPNFFCGQVLTDEDLKALVDWTAAKSSLQRFREGWGVACGLEVTRSQEPKRQSRVVVAPGYAVDCCGRDIVVCDPIYYDFVCDKPFDPCCPEPKPPNPPPPGGQPPPGQTPPFGFIDRKDLRVFELSLRFSEKLSGGQRPLVRGNCRPVDDCQYTRVIETGKLCALEVSDPQPFQPNLPDEQYHKALRTFLESLDRFKVSAQSLLDWIRHDLHSFHFVEERLCELAEDEKKKGQPTGHYEEQLFYILQDWRNQHLQCLCEPCRGNLCEGDGVPLARVWIWNKEEDACKTCKVIYIDSYPPYRRLLSPNCWPSYPGCIDLSRYIWRDFEEAYQEVSKLGFASVTRGQPFPVGNIHNLAETNRDLICGQRDWNIIIRPFPDASGRVRVMNFEKGA